MGLAQRVIFGHTAAAFVVVLTATEAQGAEPDPQECIGAHERGLSLHEGGHIIEARKQLVQCAREPCPALIREECSRLLDAVAVSTPSLVFAAVDGNGRDITRVQVSVDDRKVADRLDGKAIEVDPGEHVVRLERPGGETRVKRVLVRAGERLRVVRVHFGALSKAASSTPFAGGPRTEADVDRDPTSPPGTSSPRIFVAVDGAGIVGPGLGGDIGDRCEGTCSKTLAFGGWAQLCGGVQLSSGLGVSLDVGYLWMRTSYEDRRITFKTVPDKVSYPGSADERVTISTLTLGASASLQRGARWRWMVRVGAGVLVGSALDRRVPMIQVPTGPTALSAVSQLQSARYLYVAPEIRFGPSLGRAFDLTVGLRPVVLLALTQPIWNQRGSLPTVDSVGLVDFETESMTGKVQIFVSPSISLRYSFQ